MPIPTPFHGSTSPLCESHEWRNWSGYLAASVYEHTHEREYYAIRSAAALIDISPLFKYEVFGPEALKVVNRIFTRDISQCKIGQVMYTPWCDDDGQLIDDGTVARLEPNRFRITTAEPNLTWFRDSGYRMDADVEDVSQKLAAVAIQGPNSGKVLQLVFPEFILQNLKYYQLAQTNLDRIPVTITRTGYTGDLGYELWLDPGEANRLWEKLMVAGEGFGLAPAGMVALDIARIEAGLVMNGVDYISTRQALIPDQKSSPYEMGMSWAVDLTKPGFIGRKALLAEKQRGAAWRLVGLDLDWKDLERVFASWDLVPQVAGRASRSAVPVYQKGRKVGEMTSHMFSPLLKRYIGLASVLREYSNEGSVIEVEVTVEYSRRTVRARVVRLPFYNPAHKRA